MVGLVGVAEDITERKLAEEKLRESEELFRNTMENSPAIFFMKDMDGRYLMVNPQYEKWVGKSRGEMIGKTSAEIFPEEFSRLFVSQGREVIETGRPVSRELDSPSADGIRRIVCTKFPVRNSEGVPIAIGSIISDITDRRQAEEKLRQSRDQLRTITDNLPVMILYIDQDERYVFMNRTAEGWFGKSSESLIGKTIEENLGGSEYKKVQPYIQQVLSGQEVRFEPQLKYADGGERTIDLLLIPDREPEGGVKGYFALGRDITEFKALEDKLRQSQKMEALGTLTGGIAHDFNNILAPILGFSEILLEKADPSTKEYSNLNSIFRSAIRAKDLISQIMLFSRPGESIKVNCDLRTVAREIVGLLHSTFPKSISIQANISKNPGNVFCDPSQIYQVLLNLCVNAEQALNEEGEITISLDRAELEALPDFTGNLLSGTFVRLAVSDNGIGMGADILPHIFDPFFTRREVGEGTGLGLSTVFGIVKTHHGGIVVTSQPGEGSTFEIFFPRVEDAPEQLLDSASDVPTGDETILFVDDEEEIVILAKEVLEGKGYRVMAFSDPIEALETFKAGPGRFDLVMTDQSMPKMKGEWLVRDIRKINTEIPIILCTGYSRTISPQSGAAIGIDKFIYKPIGAKDLCRAVREVLDQAAR